ncbi:MAG TPA: MFS transporter, partial [Bryobacteraceae bacterium]|nr:MFS transporter [Bryobacteraceae bacterium]
SSVLLGLVSFAGQIPVFLMAPLGGIVADRFRRQRVVIATQTSSMVLALILAALTLDKIVQIWEIFVLSALLGVVNAFDIPARQAFFVEMVGREDLINAIALNSSMFNASRVIGPAVAGILVASIGEGWCFFANGASYIAVIIGLFLMAIETRAPAKQPASPLADVIEGFRFVVSNAPIHYLMILLGVLSVTGMPFAVLMPIFADQILHGGAKGLGILMGASGVGALAGALLLAGRETVKGLGRWVAISAGAFGVSLMAFAVSRSFWTSCALLLPVGFTMMVEMGSSNTLLQTMSPDHLRGRVMAVYSMMFMGMAPLGAVVAGVTAARWGAPATVAGGGVICIVGAAIFGWRWPELRTHARRLIAAAQMAGGVPPQSATGGGVAVK